MILVTGASGLLGNVLVQSLVAQNKQVRVFLRPTAIFKLPPNVERVHGDLLTIISIEEAMRDVTQVYHCAAKISFRPSEKKIMYQTNVSGTANIVNTCLNKGIRKLLYVSSIAALPFTKNNVPITELIQRVNERHMGDYSRSKYLAEMEVWRGIGEGLQTTIVNPSIILGNSDWTTNAAQLFKIAYEEKGWYTNGSVGFVYVQDVVNAMMILMDSDIVNERFIISAENISYKNILEQIAKAFGKKLPQKNLSLFLTELAWRVMSLQTLFRSDPTLPKELARSCQQKRIYQTSKFLQVFPDFKYTPIADAVIKICSLLSNP